MATFSMTAMRGALPSCSYRSAAAPRIAQPVMICPQSFTGFARENRLGLSTGVTNILSLAANGSKWFAMRHGNRLKKLALPADQRKALIRSLVTETLRHGSITTTKVRAKAIRKYVDKMIQLAKEGSLHSRRQALGFVFDKDIVKRLFDNAQARFGDREGGYCRVITEIRHRRGDNAEMAIIELV